MDTKLRRFKTHGATKFLAFVIVVAALAAVVVQIQYAEFSNGNVESLIVDAYKDSETFLYGEAHTALYRVARALEEGEAVDQKMNFYYFASDGEHRFSNVDWEDRASFEQSGAAFYYLENNAWQAGRQVKLPNFTYGGPVSDAVAFVVFPDDYMAGKQTAWEASRETLRPIAIGIATCIGTAILLIMFLVAVTGRKPEDRGLHLAKIDSLYSDVLLALFVPVVAFWIIFGYDYAFSGNSFLDGFGVTEVSLMVLAGGATALAVSACGVLFLSLVRKVKAGRLLKHSLIFVACAKTYDFFKSLFDGRRFEKHPLTKSLFYRQLIFIVASLAMVILTFVFLFAPPLFLVPPVLEIMMVYWYVKGNNRTYAAINRGFNESMWEQMKAERMKIALVTNVSHDLKTPLTSMVSYVDLLSKEEDLSESARDYIRILSEKTNRLKQMVSDLFDLAKSTSGDISMDMENLDIKKLIEQTLGDMADEIEKSGLQVKTRLPESPVMIFSDGKKLYRVFQNILGNALKYALDGSRIYVELEERAGGAVATVKNTAAYEMIFTADEMLQRFNRGDRARTTEGSGLGLSIAESFTKVCGGDFKVEIDGDMFKAAVSFGPETDEAAKPALGLEQKKPPLKKRWFWSKG